MCLHVAAIARSAVLRSVWVTVYDPPTSPATVPRSGRWALQPIRSVSAWRGLAKISGMDARSASSGQARVNAPTRVRGRESVKGPATTRLAGQGMHTQVPRHDAGTWCAIRQGGNPSPARPAPPLWFCSQTPSALPLDALRAAIGVRPRGRPNPSKPEKSWIVQSVNDLTRVWRGRSGRITTGTSGRSRHRPRILATSSITLSCARNDSTVWAG